MKLFFALWLAYLGTMLFPISNSAQALGTPQNIRNIWVIEGNNCTFQWNIVPGATGYRIDVANDSLFTDILPGLRNIPILQHRILLRTYPSPFIITLPPNTTTATIWGLPLGRPYYSRVRAENGVTTSENSTTFTITTLPIGCLPSEISSVSDSSLNIRWTVGQKYQYAEIIVNSQCAMGVNANSTFRVIYHPKVQEMSCNRRGGSLGLPISTNADTFNTIQIQTQETSLSLKNLMPNTSYSVNVFGPNGSVGGICEISTLPRLYASGGRMISFYEGPLPYKIPDSSAYYSRNDTVTTLENALNLVQRVRSMGITVDTMWFHASVVPLLFGRRFTPDPNGDIDRQLLLPQVCGFTLKLRQKDDRMLSLGFANRVGFWEYADNLTFYRYVFSGTTSVQIPSFALNSPLGVAPNPSNGEQTTLYYTLPQSSETSVVVVNLLGQRVFEEYLGFQHEGSHTIPLNIGHLPNGMYRVCLSATKNNAAYTMATQALTIVK